MKHASLLAIRWKINPYPFEGRIQLNREKENSQKSFKFRFKTFFAIYIFQFEMFIPML